MLKRGQEEFLVLITIGRTLSFSEVCEDTLISSLAMEIVILDYCIHENMNTRCFICFMPYENSSRRVRLSNRHSMSLSFGVLPPAMEFVLIIILHGHSLFDFEFGPCRLLAL